MKKRKSNFIYIIITILIVTFIILSVYFGIIKKSQSDSIREAAPRLSQNKVVLIPSNLLKINKEGLYPSAYINAYVSRVVDGDTIVVNYRSTNYKVRLLDIDTPESVKQDVPVQTYAKEASQFTKKNLLNKEVKLFFEKGLKDRYDRLLAHVVLKNNANFNGILVRKGFARVEIIKPNDEYKAYFYKQQELAIQDKLGVWSLPDNKNPFVKIGQGKYIPRW
jgi:micrococcal nuclease